MGERGGGSRAAQLWPSPQRAESRTPILSSRDTGNTLQKKREDVAELRICQQATVKTWQLEGVFNVVELNGTYVSECLIAM